MRSARESAAYLRQHPRAGDRRQAAEDSRAIAPAEGRMSKGACASVLQRKHTQCRAAAYLMQQQQQQLLIAAQQRIESTPQAPAEQAGRLPVRAGQDLQMRLDSASMRARSIACAAAMCAVWRNSSSSSKVRVAQQQQRNAQQSWAERTWGGSVLTAVRPRKRKEQSLELSCNKG